MRTLLIKKLHRLRRAMASLGLNVKAQNLIARATTRIEDDGRTIEKLEALLEELRPVWTEMPSAHATSAALAGLWKQLGVTNQTDAMVKLRELTNDR